MKGWGERKKSPGGAFGGLAGDFFGLFSTKWYWD